MQDHAWLRHQGDAEQARAMLAFYGATQVWIERDGTTHRVVLANGLWYDNVFDKQGFERSAYQLDRLKDQTVSSLQKYMLFKQARKIA